MKMLDDIVRILPRLQTRVSKGSMVLLLKLFFTLLTVIVPVVTKMYDELSIPIWIVLSLEFLTIIILSAYILYNKMSEKWTFHITLYISVLLILLTRVVFPPVFSIPEIKYVSQILCVAAICGLVELDRAGCTEERYKHWSTIIIALLLISSALLTYCRWKDGFQGMDLVAPWIVFLTVLSVLITYEAAIKYKKKLQSTIEKS